jgi:hypothetical protein
MWGVALVAVNGVLEITVRNCAMNWLLGGDFSGLRNQHVDLRQPRAFAAEMQST